MGPYIKFTTSACSKSSFYTIKNAFTFIFNKKFTQVHTGISGKETPKAAAQRVWGARHPGSLITADSQQIKVWAAFHKNQHSNPVT